MTKPFLRAVVETRMYRTSPSITALTRCKLGRKRRFGNGGDVRPNAALFLGLATAPNDTALNWAFAG